MQTVKSSLRESEREREREGERERDRERVRGGRGKKKRAIHMLSGLEYECVMFNYTILEETTKIC